MSQHLFPRIIALVLLLSPMAAQETPEPLLRIEAGIVKRAAWNADESRIIACVFEGFDDNRMVVYDAATGQEIFGVPEPYLYRRSACTGWNADRTRFMVVANGGVQVWDVNSGEMVLSVEGGDVLDAWWSGDGSKILTRSVEGRLSIWDAMLHGEIVKPLIQQTSGIMTDAQPLSTSNGNQVVLWGPCAVEIAELMTGEPFSWFSFEPCGIQSVAFSPHGNYISLVVNESSNPDIQNVIQVIDFNTGTQVLELPETENILEAGWTPDGSRIISLTGTGGHLWDANTGEQLVTFPQMQIMGPMNELVWSPDGERFLIGLYDLQIGNVNTGSVEALPLPLVYARRY